MEEKRNSPRLTLDIEDGFFGNFKLKGGGSLAAAIVNISAEGLNFALPQSVQDKISEGDSIMLQNIAGGTRLSLLMEVRAEVRWIRQRDTPGYISVGCCFRDLAPQVLDQLVRFVDQERKTRGQYR